MDGLWKERAETVAAYGAIAAIYGQHFAELYIKRYGGFLKTHFLAVLPGRRVLDIACGTGDLASWLAGKGYNLCACDISEQMIAQARQRAGPMRLLVCDMRALPFRAGFDGVVCTFDSINHLLNWRDLKSFFSGVLEALEPGGIFFFDANLPEGLAGRWQGEQTLKAGEEVWVMTPRYDADRGAGRFGLRGGQKGAAVSSLMIHQRVFPHEAILDALAQCGLTDLQFWDAVAMIPHDIGRRFYSAVKPA